VLEGRHEDYGNIPSVSPALSSASYVFGRYYRYRVVPSEYGQESSRLSRYFHQKPVPLEKDFNQIRRRIRISSQVPSADAKSWTKFTSNSSGIENIQIICLHSSHKYFSRFQIPTNEHRSKTSKFFTSNYNLSFNSFSLSVMTSATSR